MMNRSVKYLKRGEEDALGLRFGRLALVVGLAFLMCSTIGELALALVSSTTAVSLSPAASVSGHEVL